MATIKIDDNTYTYDTASPALPTGSGNQTAGASTGDTLVGNSLNNLLIGGAGADILEGGAGNDILVGGTLTGSFNSTTSNKQTSNDNAFDTFVFNFAFNASVAGTQQLVDTGNIATFVGSEGYYAVLAQYGDSGSIDPKSFNTWMQAYEAWYASVMNDAKFIAVDDGSADYTLDGTYRAGNKGTTSKTISFNDLQLWEMQITEGSAATASSVDGHDTIVDWFGGDTLALKGLAGISQGDFDALFNVESAAIGARNGTKVSLADGSWSVTILGMTGVTTDDAFHQLAVDNGWFV